MTLAEDTGNSWTKLSLAQQFALMGGLVMFTASLAFGDLVTGLIEAVAVRNSANASALYMESFVTPLSQDLSTQSQLTDASLRGLENLLAGTALGQRVQIFKIWIDGSKVIASSDPTIVGKVLESSTPLEMAWSGEVAGNFNALNDLENESEAQLGISLLEVYSPIRDKVTGEIIAVAEFYEDATQLEADLIRVRLTAWALVALVMAAIWGSLYIIVLRGSRTIERQFLALSDMAARNVSLRLKVQSAAARFSSLNDQALRRIGADLHDGPAQLMGFAALRLDALRKAVPKDAARTEIDQIEGAIKDAIKDIRDISRGASLPDIDRKPLDEVVRSLVDAHAGRTGSEVKLSLDMDGHEDLPLAVKICAGRVVQEGLTNTWRHAGGRGQDVVFKLQGATLRVMVRDTGPGPGSESSDGGGYGLGLAGLTGRVESLGGSLVLRNRSDGVSGSELIMELDLRGVE